MHDNEMTRTTDPKYETDLVNLRYFNEKLSNLNILPDSQTSALMNDGTGRKLIATFTALNNWQRASITLSTCLSGNTDTTGGGIAIIGLSAGDSITNLYVSKLLLGSIDITVEQEGNKLLVYVNKSTYYRWLFINILNVNGTGIELKL